MTSDERELWWLSSTDLATGVTRGGAVLGGVPASACAGSYCCLHNPSDHPLRDAPLRWRGDRRIMERVCEHGICHDAPDDLAYRRSVGAEATGAHGCCVPSCCGIEPEREQVTVPESRAVVVVDYQAGWPARFEELRAAYARALEKSQVPYRSIEHVGSTSVPGLAAKPVIDVDIVVDEPDVDAATAALEQIGFISRGDLGVSGRYAFVTPERFAPTNTYAAIEGALALRNHLAVRDVLRADPALRDEYAQVKRHAAEVAVDIDEYISLKSEFLGRVLERAGLSEADRAAIAETNRGIAGRGAHG